MFSLLMETAEPWFSSFEREVRKVLSMILNQINHNRSDILNASIKLVSMTFYCGFYVCWFQGKEEMLTSIPFARPQDSGPSVAIVTKVNRIQDQLIKKHDIELYMHLNRLEIAPQIYGM